MGGEEIEVRGFGRRTLGRARTDRAGAFRVTVKPVASSDLRVGVPADGGLYPSHPHIILRVRVVPRVTLKASSLTATALGRPVTLTGRVTPAPSRRKAIVLEWRDPQRGTWRPVLNTHTRPDGTFAVAWRFQTPGFRIPLRVRAIAERGWPLEPASSPTLVVAVR